MGEPKPEYPCSTLADMADIPVEAQPRFLAELPHMLKALREMREAAPTLAVEIRAKAPWPFNRLPVSLYEKTIVQDAAKRIRWVDDDKGTATLHVKLSRGDQPFYSRTERIKP